MEENRKKLHEMIDKVDNPKILENLMLLTEEYIEYYSNQPQKSEAD